MVKICPKCGKENKDSEEFCEQCGYDLDYATSSGGGKKPEPGTPPEPPTKPKLVITSFKGRLVSGELLLEQGENIIGREDIKDATNNTLDEGDYLYISRKENGGHVKIMSAFDSQKFSIEHISQREGVKTMLNGISIEGNGLQTLKDGDKIVLNDAFELIFEEH
ncbi:MAG: hypothetical protein CHKLHMKO_00470 [Candidatus Argoarchaeum ethanivorans]|uniref:Zinc-ribbon domain-containing protein n=1 Tax=Candidatus Argoarchaeum ethanivorans TaxID=2608793 RepID=A0A811TCB2_9EURY|nr:MAG: hypothetical protein CHKLHMKO_00470 [Candidatus Argoarchaeum ethanivorans]